MAIMPEPEQRAPARPMKGNPSQFVFLICRSNNVEDVKF